MRKVIQASQETFTVNLTETKRLFDGTTVTTPFDLGGFTEIKFCFKGGATLVEKLESDGDVSVIGADIDGKVQSTLEVADSDSFAPTQGDLEIEVTKPAGNVRKFQVLGAFQIIEKICT